MTYASAKAHQDKLTAACTEAGKALKAYPRNAIGLTPDHVKASPEWRRARRAYDLAFAELRAFNAGFVKTYAKEYRADLARDRKGRAGLAR